MNKIFKRMENSTDVHVSLYVRKHCHMIEVTLKAKGHIIYVNDELKISIL